MDLPSNSSPERTNFSQRLIDTLESSRALKASPTTLAREFNFHFAGTPVSVHAARKWLVGDAIPTQDKLRSLANWLGVSVEWLRFGEAGQSGNVTSISLSKNLPCDKLIHLFLSLPHKERELAQDFIRMLVAKNHREGEQRIQEQAEYVTHPRASSGCGNLFVK